jgi:cation diffusion facilitator CzcD-associated flavoprotein CzcO
MASGHLQRQPSTRSAAEHLDVVVVGAGLSGIGAGHHLQTSCPWASYAILEARDAIGGTWDLFRYPGIRSDSDMYTLGYGFRPWTGEKTIADGADIRRYIQQTAADEGIDQRIRFHHRVRSAEWSSADARWTLTVERSDTGTVEQLTCSFLFSCTGYYRYDRGYLPEFADLDRYQGIVVHPQAWPEDLEVAGRKVVVIGSGATAITLVPSLADLGAEVTMVQRSPSYIATVPNPSPLARLVRRVLPGRLGADVVRWLHALITQGSYAVSRKRPAFVRKALIAGVRRQLPAGYDVATHFTPHYNPWDQRLCAVPNGDLFREIRNGRVTVVTDHIDRFTEQGLRLRSGRELPADVVVTATGLELLFLGGMELRVDGEPVDLASRMVYKGMMLEGVPNLAFAVGYTNASWTLKCDLTCEYVCRLLDHLRRTGTEIATPVNEGADVSPEPLLGLTSGYVLRAVDRFPKQGSRFPWKVYQSYLKDYRALKRSPVDDGVMQFTTAPRAAQPEVAAAG